MKTLPTMKAGDSFAFDIQLLDKNGDPLPIVDAKSQLRDVCDDLVEDLTFTAHATDTSKGTFSALPADTADWPITRETGAMIRGDVRFTYADGTVESTEPFSFQVTRGATHA